MAYSAINKSSSFMNSVLYSSNGTAIGSGGLTVTGFDFTPAWLYLKQRDASESSGTYDTVRGVTKSLRFNGADVEDTRTEGVSTFNSSGFICGSDSRINPSGTHPCVAFGWKAGTSVSGTTSGSGTGKSYTGSVNTDAGFSIIKYSGNNTAGHTIPHHLGVVPQMIIEKELGSANSWYVYHHSLGNTKNLLLDSTAAEATSATVWNNTTPTSTVFTLGSSHAVNRPDGSNVAYCFAEVAGYSKMGSYIGNGDANGTFVYTGFQPTWLLVKRAIGGTQDWQLFDNKINPYNVATTCLRPNLGDGDQTGNAMDLLSTGFKNRLSGSSVNTNGDTYIYMAFGQPIISNSGVVATAR